MCLLWSAYALYIKRIYIKRYNWLFDVEASWQCILWWETDLLFSLVWNTWMELEGKHLLSENNVRVGEGMEKTMRGSSVPGISPDTLKTWPFVQEHEHMDTQIQHYTQFAGGLRCDWNSHVSSHARFGRHTQYSILKSSICQRNVTLQSGLLPCSVARDFGVLLFVFRLICNGGVVVLFFVFPLNVAAVWGVCGYASWQTCSQRAGIVTQANHTHASLYPRSSGKYWLVKPSGAPAGCGVPEVWDDGIRLLLGGRHAGSSWWLPPWQTQVNAEKRYYVCAFVSAFFSYTF